MKANTLNTLFSEGIFNKVYLSTNLRIVADTCENYVLPNVTKASPDIQAIRFYYFSHVVSVIKSLYKPDEVLPEELATLVKLYTEIVKDQAKRLFYYSLLICTRESRHILNIADFKHKWDKHNVNHKDYRQLAYEFFSTLKGHNSSSAVQFFYDSVPNLSLSLYVSLMHDIFYDGNFHGGYGGKAWANVCLNLLKFVKGEYNAEIFIDTAYTLSHNNGSIFNKGMLYNKYSNNFAEILDVQRSGQIPQYIFENHTKITTGISSSKVMEDNDLLGGKLLPYHYVDWYKVEFLGALENYAHNQLKQTKEYGISEYEKLINKKKIEAAFAATIAKQAKEKEQATKYLSELLGGESLPTNYDFADKVVTFGIQKNHKYPVLLRKVSNESQ